MAAREGRLFIADPGSAGIHIIGLHNNSFDLFIPQDRGRLKLPVNCHVDERGNLYVADAERRQVVIFDHRLEYRGEIGDTGTFKPIDVHVSGDSVFISDPPNNRICVYNRSTLEQIYSIPGSTEQGDESWLYNPVNLYVEGDRMYITDFGHSRIKVFGTGGTYITSVGSYGRNHGQFVRPKGIAVDRDRNLYVVDAGFQNVQVFDDSGRLLMFFGGPYKGAGDMYLPAMILIDYENLEYFRKYVDPGYHLEYLILVTNQYGPDKLNVYGRIRPQ